MGKRIDTKEFIKRAKIIHGDKYDYSLAEYNGYANKLIIICKNHGRFLQRPSNHLDGKGCNICGNTKTITQDEFIQKAILIHNGRYDYSLCHYKNAKTKVSIICKEHGAFEQIASSHTDQKTGCPMCSKKHKYSNDEFIQKASLVHNNKYNYNNTNYINNYTKVRILCKSHGDFMQTPSNHLSGKGCEICCSSKNENLISIYLKMNNVDYYQQHKFIDCKYKRRLPFDFYLPEHKMCIEFQGRQHYEPIEWFGGYDGFIKQQKRDHIKKNYCTNHNLKLLLIKYDDNINDLLHNHVIKSLPISH